MTIITIGTCMKQRYTIVTISLTRTQTKIQVKNCLVEKGALKDKRTKNPAEDQKASSKTPSLVVDKRR